MWLPPALRVEPSAQDPLFDRRQALRGGLLGGAALLLAPGAFADELLLATPRVTEGPYYPDRMPLDTDNDLLIVNDSITPAVGEITLLSGRVLSRSGAPVRSAVVEIWQVDGQGAYLNTTDPNHSKYDTNFQGYGRFTTDREGRYFFRTIKPIPYTGRAPHIHVAVSQNGRRVLTTQILIKGHPQNRRDGVLNSVRDPKLRELLLADFVPAPESKLGELMVSFDLVLGVTPADPDEVRGGIGAREGDRMGGPGGFGGAPPPRRELPTLSPEEQARILERLKARRRAEAR